MRRLRLALVAVLSLGLLSTALPAHQPAGQTQQSAVFRSNTNLVHVDAYPMKDGRILTNLEQSDFEIFEDGKPQKIESFELVKIDPYTPDAVRRDPNTVRESLEAAADPKNRVFVVYLDAPHVTIAGAHRTKTPLVQALNRVLAPGDLFGVMTPDIRPSDIAFGRMVMTAEDMLTRYWPWGQRDSILRTPEEEALEPCTNDPRTGQPLYVADGAAKVRMLDALIDRLREDKVLTHLESTIDFLGSVRETRKSLIVFTEGWLLYEPDHAMATSLGNLLQYVSAAPGIGLGANGRMRSGANPFSRCISEVQRLANLSDQARFRQLVQRAQRSNVVFYPVNPSGLQVFDTPINRKQYLNERALPSDSILQQEFNRITDRTAHLREAAENTGGIAVIQNDVAKGLERIANELSAYYVLGYYSTNTQADGRYRQIDVKLKVPGVKVTARRGYRAPTEAEMATRNVPKSVVPAAEAAAAEELVAALAPLARVRASAELYGWGARTGASELTLFAEVAASLADKWSDGGDMQVVVTTPSGEQVALGRGRLDAVSRGATARVALPSGAKGPWNAQVRIKGAAEQLETSVAIPDTPPPSATTLLGAMLMYRAAPGPTAVLRPSADLQFRRSERVHVEWKIATTFDTRDARLLDRAGNPLPVQITLGEKPGVLAADVNLAPLTAGDYIIDLAVTSGVVTAKAKVAFRIVN